MAVHSLAFQGKRIMGDQWPGFFKALGRELKLNGLEAPDSDAELLLFNYGHPFSAITSFFESLEKIKKERGWKETLGTVPVQILLHLEKKGDTPPHFREASSPIWDSLLQGIPYITRSLKLAWDQLMVGRDFPPCHLISDESGLFQIKFSEHAEIKSEKLFPYRDMAIRGSNKECFYCGMTNHLPAKCPSKHLTTENRAIFDIGYLSFAELSSSFKEAFTNQKKMINLLAAGVDAAQIRKDPVLCVFISYFGICLIYQPRFLWYMAFSSNTLWDGTCKIGKLNIDSHNLRVGLDCLRVGQLSQARELLRAENQMMSGKQFYANIGLAFVALELGRKDDMIQHLDIANGLANNEKERIYVSLLISRYHDIAGHLWKADQTIQPVYNLYLDCAEALYRKIQIMVRGGEGKKILKVLQELSKTYRHIFMTALMDPMLLPIHGVVEDMLAAQVQVLRQSAQENLIKAREECAIVQGWFDSEDKDLQVNLTTLENLEKQFKRKSYYDLLDVYEKAKALAQSCPRLQESRLEMLNEKVDNVVIKWDVYHAYWKSYPYKPFFGNFHEILRGSKRKLVETRSIAAKSLGKAIKNFDSAIKEMKGLTPLFYRMNKTKTAFDIIGVFGKHVVLCELVLGTFIFMLFPLATIFGADFLGETFIQLVRNPEFQKKGLFVTGLLVAPLLAFAITLRKLVKA